MLTISVPNSTQTLIKRLKDPAKNMVYNKKKIYNPFGFFLLLNFCQLKRNKKSESKRVDIILLRRPEESGDNGIIWGITETQK